MGGPDVSTLLDLVRSREAILGALRDGSFSKSELVEEVHFGRVTTGRAVDDLEDAGLVAPASGEYVTTQVGSLALDRYRTLLGDDWSAEDVKLLGDRLDFLDALDGNPSHKPDLVDRLDRSRSTVDRAIRSLADRGWVERESGGYGLTTDGEKAVARYRDYVDDLRSVLDTSAVLTALPPDQPIPMALATAGRTVEEEARYHLFELLADGLASADRYRIVLPRVFDSRHLRLCHRHVLESDLDLDVVAPPAVVTRLREEFPHVVGELADRDGVTVYEGSVPEFGLLLATEDLPGDRGAETTVVVVPDTGGPAGFAVSTDPAVVSWATGLAEAARSDAEVATDDWRTARAAADLPRLTGERLPGGLRTEGFVKVDRESLDRRDPLEPTDGWRAGLGLAEVDAGHAIARYPDPGANDGDPAARSLAERIASKLQGGSDVAVLGPPGSGKSTVCKRVAVDWVRERDGVVIYRESGYGQPFDSPGVLEALLDRLPGPVLVVVEDAVRPEAASVFEVVRRSGGRDDVRFLVDATETAWTDPQDASGKARVAAYRYDRVDTEYVPPMREGDCERALERAATLAGDIPDLPPDELLEDVREHASDAGASPGAASLLFHRLAWFADPLVDDESGRARSTLDEHVDRVRSDLADLGPGGLAVGGLCSLLAAAGVGVSPAYLYALTARDGVDPGTVQDAIDRLRGDILFDGDDGVGYQIIQKTWAVRFLERFQEADEHRAQLVVGNALTDLLALADDPDRRERVARCTGGRVPALKTVLADPTAWADEVVTSVFRLGVEYPKLAKLFGTTTGSAIELPDALPAATETNCTEWRGRMYTAAGAFDRADEEFERLGDRVDDPPSRATASVRFESLSGRCAVARRRGDLETATDRGREALDVADDLDDHYTGRARLALGTVARDRGAFDEAERHLRAAQAAFDDDDARRVHATVWDTLGDIATQRGRYDRARECYRESETIYETIGDERGTARSLHNFGDVAFEEGDVETAREKFLRALKIARDVGHRGQETAILVSLGTLSFYAGEVDDATEFFERALTLAADVEDARQVASIRTKLGTLANSRGDLDDAVDHHTVALSRAREIGDRKLVASCLQNLSALAQRRDELPEAETRARQGLELAREIGDRQLEVSCLQSLGTVSMYAGELARAARHLETVASIAADMDDSHAMALAACFRARTARRRGRLDDASEYAAEYRSLTRADQGSRPVGLHPETLSGLIALEDRRFDEARAHFEEAIADVDPASEAFYPKVFLARVTRRRGDLESAVENVSAANDVADTTTRRGVCLVERGANAAADGRFRDAERRLVEAVELLDGTDRFVGTHALRHLARVDERRGSPEEARDRLRECVERYRDMGAKRRAKRTAEELEAVRERLDDPNAERGAAGREDGEGLNPYRR